MTLPQSAGMRSSCRLCIIFAAWLAANLSVDSTHMHKSSPKRDLTSRVIAICFWSCSVDPRCVFHWSCIAFYDQTCQWIMLSSEFRDSRYLWSHAVFWFGVRQFAASMKKQAGRGNPLLPSPWFRTHLTLQCCILQWLLEFENCFAKHG